MPKEAPTGTVTFLFTDIEGLTRLLQELGQATYGVVRRTRTPRSCGAVEWGPRPAASRSTTEGDSFFVAFSERAPEAVARPP